jgi:hypothetical protein
MPNARVADHCPVCYHLLLPTSYGIRCIAWTPDGRAFDLGGRTATTADGALVWLRHRVWEVAEQLDPPALQLAERWICDRAEQATALAALVTGEEFDLDLVSDRVRYAFVAQAKHWPDFTVSAGSP